MKRALVMFPVLAGLLAAIPAATQEQRDRFDGAIGADVIYSSDADDTEVIRAGANLDLAYDGPEDYLGIRLERFRFNPSGEGWAKDDRIYLRAADTTGLWSWAANLGTNGDTVLGAITAHDHAKWRKELFFERDLVETRRSVKQPIYYTFAGGVIDVPLGERDTLALVAGVQDFTGENRRLHLRANYVHVLKPEWGLSAQLRTRWFRNSDPRELDYYSPRWYAQVLPVLQLRRTSASGWKLAAAGGVGLQRDSASGWRRSSYLDARVTSPPVGDGWAVTGGLTYSETPTTAGTGYHYFQVTAGTVFAF